MKLLKCLIILTVISLSIAAGNITPIVLWHGMGDTCCFPFSLGAFKRKFEGYFPGIYIKSIRIGPSIITDFESGYFVHPNKQVDTVCKELEADKNLQNGFNAIGFSQGGQFLRAVVQRCDKLNVRNLISFGGQHQGVFGLPNCPALSHQRCEEIRRLLNVAAYRPWLQNFLVQATYWHNPMEETTYRNYSTFLADINNERIINEDYKRNLQKLEKLVLVKFTNDTIVQPKETQWFEFYAPNQDQKILPLNASDIYLQDKLGLRQMINENKIVFLESEGNHLQFTDDWLTKNIIPILTN